jgi:hypothetical protein
VGLQGKGDGRRPILMAVDSTLSEQTDWHDCKGAPEHGLARIIHKYRREAAETETCRGFSKVRARQADLRSVEETEREKPRQAMGSAAVAGIHELSGQRNLSESSFVARERRCC